jgi:hypothetical protein
MTPLSLLSALGLLAMIKGETRHQLFLPVDLSRRVEAMAKSQKRSRSDLLAEN